MFTLKQRNQISENWILDNITSNIDDRAALDGVELNTPKLKLEYLHQVFMVQGYMGRDGAVKEFEDYIRGLPSVLDIVYSNYDIRELLVNTFGYTETQAEKHQGNYWNYVSNRVFQLIRKYKVEVNK